MFEAIRAERSDGHSTAAGDGYERFRAVVRPWRCVRRSGRAEGEGPKPRSKRTLSAAQGVGFELGRSSRRQSRIRAEGAEPKARARSLNPTPPASRAERGLAERVGFEPTVEFPLHTLSKRAPSATRPSLPSTRFARSGQAAHRRTRQCTRMAAARSTAEWDASAPTEPARGAPEATRAPGKPDWRARACGNGAQQGYCSSRIRMLRYQHSSWWYVSMMCPSILSPNPGAFLNLLAAMPAFTSGLPSS